MSAAQWFSALQTRSKREVQEAFNRKQEEIQLRNIRHATFGQELEEIKQDILTQENTLRATYADDPKYLSELENFVNYDFRGGNPTLDFYQKTFKKDIFGYGLEQVLDRTGFAQAITGNPNIITVAANNDEQGNFNPVLVNKAGGGDGSKQVITTATEDAKELQFGGVPYKLSPDATGKYLNSYFSTLRQTTKGTSLANLATLEAVATGIPVPPRNNIASLTGVPVEAMEDATAAPQPGNLLASIMRQERSMQSLSEDEYQEALNDPYLAYLIEGQQMENIDDLGTLKSVADQGMYSGINRRIIESAWKKYEEKGGPDATQGRRTNNPLNLKFNAKNKWMGKKESENGFETFDDMAYGIRAADDTLKTYDNYNIDTVAKVINRWAPSNENNTDEYIKFVAKELNISPNDKIDLQNDETRQNLLKAMVKMESPDVTLTDEMIAAARDLSVVAYRGLSAKKEDLVGVTAKIRGKTVVENTLPFMEYKDAEGRNLTGDALFDEIMGETGFIRGEPLSQTGPAQGRPTSYRGDDFATRNDVTGSDLLAGNNKYKSYFYKEGSTPFDLTADQVDSLDNKQRNLLLLKAKQVTKSNLNRMRNNIVDQKEQFSDANEIFYQKVAGKLGLGLGNKRTRRELRRDNQLDQFFANNPEYGREFFDLGAKGFADKYQNDLGFVKNFPTTEDKELFKKELKEIKHNARKELSDLLVYRTDENSDKANLEFLDMGERFKMLSLLYTSQAGGQKPLIDTNDFSDAMRSFTATGQIDFAAATGRGSTETPQDPLNYANIGGGIQPVVDRLMGFKRNEQGGLVKQENYAAALSLIYDSEAAEKALSSSVVLGNMDEIGRLMEFKAQNFNNPQIVNMMNNLLEKEQIRRLVGHADTDNPFGARDLTADQFQDTIMMNVLPMISVQLKYRVGEDEFTYFPMNTMQAANMISNGASLHGYQFYGDDGRTIGEFVEAADLPRFDQQSAIDILGLGVDANGKLSRTADLQAKLQAKED